MSILGHNNLLSPYRMPSQNDNVLYPAGSADTTGGSFADSTQSNLKPNNDMTNAKMSDSKKSAR